MKTRYWWPLRPETETSLQEYVFTCTLCQMTRKPVGLHPAPLEPLPVSDPFDLWIIDVLGPLLQTLKATGTFWHVVTSVRCGLRRNYLNLAMLSRLQKQYIQIFSAGLGCPRTFSDRRTNFASKFNINALCKLCKIEQSFSSSYHHQTCGRAEQFMSSILKTFRLYCTDDSEWSKYIDSVLLSLSCT